MKPLPCSPAAVVLLLGLAACRIAGPAEPWFRFEVVDAETGRGVPLVELTTVHGARYVTDSAGVAAIREPDLMGGEVWFHVRSHGYRVPEDGFGYRGVRVRLIPGGSHTLRIERTQPAERLYRITGAGIYRDSRLLGDPVPLHGARPAGGVLGQDSVQSAVYRGRLHWFWGDTSRAPYPLGNFETSGAVSRLPGDGGLSPDVGIDLEYFVGEDGFSRPMCPIPGPGPVWIDGLVVLGAPGDETMLCHYARMKNLGTRLEHGIAEWNDDTATFEKVRELTLDAPLHPRGRSLEVTEGGVDWLYFPAPYPSVRVRARRDHLLEPGRYQAYTCLVAGARWDAAAPALDRAADGALRWAWKADTAVVTPARWNELVEAGHVGADEGWMNLTDVATGERIRAHGGTVAWNEHRGRWVMVFLQVHGRSVLGEVWYAEAGSLLGPWRDARRIVTHDDYSFYNVAHHPFFDRDGGRVVYLEGTYTRTFSGSEERTPRYDYNQILYRLDLEDPRLGLPAPGRPEAARRP